MELKDFTPQKLLAISGKIGSGKDTLTTCLQIMTSPDSEIVSDFYDNPEMVIKSYSGIIESQSRFTNVKFASDVKLIVAKILGVTVRQLEDRTFKEEVLSEDWWYYKVGDAMIPYLDTQKYSEEEKAKLEQYLVKLTPRRIFQLIATEGGRQIIHPNIWVNSLFSRYKENADGNLPNWVISDMRFVNEFNACVNKGAITIRVVRHKPLYQWLEDFAIELPDLEGLENMNMSDTEFLEFIKDINNDGLVDLVEKLTHESETQLDDMEHDYVIHNDGNIEDLVNKLREVLIEEGVELTKTEVENFKLKGGL